MIFKFSKLFLLQLFRITTDPGLPYVYQYIFLLFLLNNPAVLLLQLK